MLTTPSLTLKRKLNAAPERVYAAWTDPEKLARWFGPEGTEIDTIEADVTVGGAYRFVLQESDCSEHEVGGVYREIVENEKLVFTWAWKGTPEQQSLVTVRIKPDGDGTILTLIHEQLPDEEMRDRHEDGWTGSFDKLERLFA